MAAPAQTVGARPLGLFRALPASGLAVPTILFAVAAGIRAWVVTLMPFPLTEGSAYYVDVARNLVTGRGLVIDSIWSYATPPLTLPRPAFELWQPAASIIAAVPMAVAGPTFAAAQLGYVVLGALLAPLTWLVARDAAFRLGLPMRRAAFVATGAGLLAAVGGPFLVSTAVPDSTLPFTVLAVASCLAMPRAVAGERPALVALGVLLGLAYLTRMEAVWLGATFVLIAVVTRPGWRNWLPVSMAVAAIGALVAAPWWARNFAVFGTPLPGQLADNVFLTRNEQIFAYVEQPSLEAFLAQGGPTLIGNIANAIWHNVVNVLLIPAAPIVVVGVAALAAAALRGRQTARQAARTPLGAILVSGAITLVATTLLFPVATLWGTFEHASGPLLVGLAIAAVLGGDAFVAWLVRRRDWRRDNAWLAPLALFALTLPLALFHVASAAAQSVASSRTVASLARTVPAQLLEQGIPLGSPVITDRPLWMSDALDRPALALSDEPPAVVLRLAADFGARAVVVVARRGEHPESFRGAEAAPCLRELPIASAGARAAEAPAVFVIRPECVS